VLLYGVYSKLFWRDANFVSIYLHVFNMGCDPWVLRVFVYKDVWEIGACRQIQRVFRMDSKSVCVSSGPKRLRFSILIIRW